MTQRPTEGLRIGAWLALAVFAVVALTLRVVMADAPDLTGPTDPDTVIVPATDRVPPLPPVRTISILSGTVLRFAVVSKQGGVTLDLLMRVPQAGYEQLPAFRGCRRGCALRVHIIQVGRP